MTFTRLLHTTVMECTSGKNYEKLCCTTRQTSNVSRLKRRRKSAKNMSRLHILLRKNQRGAGGPSTGCHLLCVTHTHSVWLVTHFQFNSYFTRLLLIEVIS